MKNITQGTAAAILAVVLLTACGKQEAPTAPAPAPAPAADQSASAPATEVSEYVLPDGLAGAGYCALDVVNGQPPAGATAVTNSDVSFGGWAADASKQVPTQALFVLKGSEKTYSVPLVVNGDRPDVATALSSEPLKSSGYNLPVRLTNVVPGTYELMVMLGGDNPAVCVLPANLVVTN